MVFFLQILFHILLLRILISSLSHITSITLFTYLYQNQIQTDNSNGNSNNVILDEYMLLTSVSSNTWDEQLEKQLGFRNLYDICIASDVQTD